MSTQNLGRVVGYSAYELAVLNGFVGSITDWLESLKGEQGDKAWFPIFATVPYLNGVVLQVIDWDGGEGEKPPFGGYLGEDGYVENISEATLLGEKGDKGDKGDQGEQGIPGISTTNMNTNRVLGRTSIGTGTPEELELIGGYLSGNNVIIGATNGSGSIIQKKIDNPKGGQFLPPTNNNTGAIQIKVPNVGAGRVCYIKGSIVEYNSPSTIDFLIGFSTSGSPIGNRAILIGDLNKKLTVRFATESGIRYIYIGELATTWTFTNVFIESFVVSYAATSDVSAIQPFEISLQSSAFIGTINTTQTETRPSFNPQQVMSDYEVGANTVLTNTMTLNQMLGVIQGQISARLTQAQGDTRYNAKSIYNANSGMLVQTDIPASSTSHFSLNIIGNAFSNARLPIKISVNGYSSPSEVNYVTSVISGDSENLQPISIFKLGGFVCFWVGYSIAYSGRSFSFYCECTFSSVVLISGSDKGNRVNNITNASKPTTGVTNEVVTTPTKFILNNGSNTNLLLGDGNYLPLSDFRVRNNSDLGTADLNTITAPGDYVQSTASNTTLARNYPLANNAGTLEVVANASLNRIIHRYTITGGSAKTCQRYLSGGTWSAWKVITFDGETIPTTEKGANNGVASLDSSGKIPPTQLPLIAITDTFVVNSQASMLALTAQKGDVCVRTDLTKTFILAQEPATTLVNWAEMLAPTGGVVSVAGKTGAVSLVKADVGLGNVDNTSDANKPISTAVATALAEKATIIKQATSVTGTEVSSTRVKNVTVTGATVGDAVQVSEPIICYGSLTAFKVYGRVTAPNNVRLHFMVADFQAGTTDATFYELFDSTDLPDVGVSSPVSLTITVIK